LVRIILGFSSALCATVLVATVACWGQVEQQRQRTLILSTRAALASVSSVLSALQDAETGQRGYLLTGERSYLEPYDAAVVRLGTELPHLKEMAVVPQGKLVDLEDVATAKLAEVLHTVELRRAGRGEEALEWVKAGRGETLMSRARSDVEAIREEEQRLLEARQSKFLRMSWIAFLATLTGVGVLLLLTGLTAVLVHREWKEQEQILSERRRVHEYRERLLSIVGHDIRNPLGVIEVGAQLLAKTGKLASPQVEILKRMERGATRIEGIVDLLVDFTQARLGQGIPINPAPADLRQVLRGVVEQFLTSHPSQRIEVEAEGDCTGLWHAERLEQVFSNLIGNAIQHGGGHSPVRIRLEPAAQSVRVRVTNSGEPISPELLPHVFEPYRRGGDSRAQGDKGLGLGLYIVREVIRAHNGTVAVASSAREGTTFTLELPRQLAGARLRPREETGAYVPAGSGSKSGERSGVGS
jgi:signal transduction histidine kinase